MTPVVVDGSVVPKWFFSEPNSIEALSILTRDWTPIAPAFVAIEWSSVLVGRVLKGDISRDRADSMFDVLLELGITFHPDRILLPVAIELATLYHRSLYDCLYAALALREGCQVVTADRPFYEALRVPFPSTMLWIEDLPAALA